MIQLVLIVLAMHYWCLYTGVNVFLSVILAIITYVPNTQTQSQGDQSQCKPTDKQIPENCLVERAPASTDLPLELSVMDVQRLAQMEHWRDICISVVEKGCRRQR